MVINGLQGVTGTCAETNTQILSEARNSRDKTLPRPVALDPASSRSESWEVYLFCGPDAQRIFYSFLVDSSSDSAAERSTS